MHYQELRTRRRSKGTSSPSGSAATSTSTTTGPGLLWEHLGTRPGRPFVPFAAQAEILSRIHVPWPGKGPRVFCVRCGRRLGKTTIGEKLLWKGVMAPDDLFGPPAVRLTADTEEHAQKIWRLFVYHMENTPLKALVKDHSKEFNRIEFINGATLQMFSANNPKTLSGDGVSLWVIDEAQFFSQEAYDNMFPSATERNGIIVMLGVAEGDGPFRAASFMGESPDFPEYADMHYPTSANPFIPADAIAFAQRTLAPHKFQQLYLANWVSEIGTIFQGVEACIAPAPYQTHDLGFEYTELPRLGHTYYGGLDLARLSDWSVFSISNNAGRVVAWDRFSRLDWELQKDRFARLSALYGHPLTAADATGVGDPIVQDLTRLGMNIREVRLTSNAAKNSLIDALAVRIASKRIHYPNIPVLIRELKRFEAKRSKSGQYIVYAAPNGENDDFVLSLALLSSVLPAIPHQELYTSEMTKYQEELFDGEEGRQRGPWEDL